MTGGSRREVWGQTLGALLVAGAAVTAGARGAAAQVEGGEQPAPAPASPAPAPSEAAPDRAAPAPSQASRPAAPAAPAPPAPALVETSSAPPATSFADLISDPPYQPPPDPPLALAARGYLVPPAVLERAALRRGAPRGLGERLQLIPVQGDAVNAQYNNGGDASTRLSLRSLGASRTLVLLDGRPIVAGGLGGDDAVDLNLLPLAMIERVEVRTDGDAVRYGSGAIGGTINLVPRRKLEGSEVALASGLSTHGDGARYDASFVTGWSERKGDLVIGLGYQRQQAVRASERDFSSVDRLWSYADNAPLPNLSQVTPGGRIDTARIDVNGDGQPGDAIDVCGRDQNQRPISTCTAGERGGFRPFTPSDFYDYQPESYLIPPSQRMQLAALGAIHLSPRTRAFGELWAASATAEQRLAADPLADVPVVSRQSVYNPIGGDLYGYSRRLTELGPRRATEDYESLRLVVGLEGAQRIADLGEWRWQASVTHGRSRAELEQRGFVALDRLALAVGPSFIDVDGVARCGTPFAILDGCVPINLLAGGGANAISRDMLDYVGFRGTSSGENRQTAVRAEAAGRLAQLPSGGEVGLRFGAEYRRDAGSFTADSLVSRGATTAPLAANLDGDNNAGALDATLFADPLRRDHGLLRELGLEAGVRLAHHDSFPSAFAGGVAWKLGAQLRTRPGVSFFASYRSSFRAASLAERFTAPGESSAQEVDPCGEPPDERAHPIEDRAGKCAEQGVPSAPGFFRDVHRTRTGGRAELDAERAGVLALGVSAEPAALPGLRLGASYFRTEVTDRIASLGVTAIFTRCYERGDDEACARIHRDPDVGHTIAYVDDRTSNGGGFTTSGIDFSAGYQHATGDHRFHHQLDGVVLLDYLFDDTVTERQGRGSYDLGSVHPRLSARLESSWDYHRFGAGAALRVLSGFDECFNADCADPPIGVPEDDVQGAHQVSANATLDVHGRYLLDSCLGGTELELGVSNLLDEDPAAIYSAAQADSDAATYDYMGRFLYLRVTQQF